MVKLRSYQQDAIRCIIEKFRQTDRQYVIMPTGAGKTITFLDFASKNYSCILIIVPSKELLKQVYETALLFWDEHNLSRKGAGYNESLEKVHIVIANSLRDKYVKEIATGEFDLIIIDEAHHVQSNTYRKTLDAICNTSILKPNILGVTATPDRLDGKLLSELLHECSYKITIEKLIEDKFLCDVEGYTVKTNIDLSEVDDHNGDFSISQLYKKLSNDARNNIILNICKEDMAGRKTIVFCINVKHAQEIAKSLNTLGLSAKAIHGKMNSIERNGILQAFRNGEISYLCNCQMLTEGFDEPSIDGVLLARPTRSKALFLQMIGRGLRIYPRKSECKIIDIVDNHRSLASFSSMLDGDYTIPVERFGSFKGLKETVEQKIFESIEIKTIRVNFFSDNKFDEIAATPSMEEYLKANVSSFYENLSFDEASFAIWHNELRKEYENAN